MRGNEARRRPLSFRPLSLAGRPMSRPRSSSGNRIGIRTEIYRTLWPVGSRGRNFHELTRRRSKTEATAGIEPAMKVLQTFDLLLGLTLRLSSRRAKGAPQSDRPFSLLG